MLFADGLMIASKALGCQRRSNHACCVRRGSPGTRSCNDPSSSFRSTLATRSSRPPSGTSTWQALNVGGSARCSPLSQRHSAQPVPIGQSIGPSQAPLFQRESEVRTGFEPAYNGFANRCLTTWLPHLAWKRADLATSQGQDQWSRAGFAFLWRRNWPAGFC